MKAKIGSTLAVVALCYLVPLIGRPALIVSPEVAVLVVVASILMLSQPRFSMVEARDRTDDDRFSIVFILLAGIVSQAIPVIEWAYVHRDTSAAFTGAGIAIMTVGLTIRIAAIRSLGSRFTGTVHVETEQAIVSRGLYRVVRHPSYLGAFLTLLGTAVFLQAWVALAIAAVLLGFVYRYRILSEEAVLLRECHDTYTTYQSHTRWRLIPMIW